MTTVEALARDARSAAAHSASGTASSIIRFPNGQHVGVSYDLDADCLTYRIGGRAVDESQLRVTLLDLESRFR